MKIGLLDIDGQAGHKSQWGATAYPNLALCKIAAWHKAQGDTVEWATPFEYYDILYRSKIFNTTPDDLRVYWFGREVRGGTGYNIQSVLPQEIDDTQPDLTIYPGLPADTSYGFLTRGCPNTCAWCVVPTKEGRIRPYWDVDRVANGRRNLILMDNNILAAGEYGIQQLQKIIERGYRVDFNQALDARRVTEENAAILARIKWLGRLIRFGCDTPGQVRECERAIRLIRANGYKGEFFLYTMLTANYTETYNRLHHWHPSWPTALKGVYPYAQPYLDPHNPKNTPPSGSTTWRDGVIANQFIKRAYLTTTAHAKASAVRNIRKNYTGYENKDRTQTPHTKAALLAN